LTIFEPKTAYLYAGGGGRIHSITSSSEGLFEREDDMRNMYRSGLEQGVLGDSVRSLRSKRNWSTSTGNGNWYHVSPSYDVRFVYREHVMFDTRTRTMLDPLLVIFRRSRSNDEALLRPPVAVSWPVSWRLGSLTTFRMSARGG
jgi:hypothetical protein